MKNQLKELINWVKENKHCDFYRGLYKNADASSWENIPCTSKEEIKGYEKKGKKFLFVPDDEVAGVTMTSGTTDTFLTVYLSKKDLEMKDKKISASVKENYSDDARIISIFSANFAGKHPKAYEKYVTVEGDIYGLKYSAELISKMNINSIRTFPTIALRLGEILEIMNYDKIKLLVLSGEYVSELTKKELANKFPNARIAKLCGMAEFSNLGWQCKHISGTEFYHTLNEFLKYEILLENGEIKEHGTGELIITALWTGSAFPLIRYRTGDLAALTENICKCGEKGKMLSLLGRVNIEGVRVGGITLRKKNIDAAISALGDFKDYQIHVHEKQKQERILPKIVFHIMGESRDEKGIKEIENRLMENLQLTPSYNWKNAVKKGIFLPLEVKFVSGVDKKRVVDHRIKSGGNAK